jgi:O-antigen/teichoic acid export membrane protein
VACYRRFRVMFTTLGLLAVGATGFLLFLGTLAGARDLPELAALMVFLAMGMLFIGAVCFWRAVRRFPPT